MASATVRARIRQISPDTSDLTDAQIDAWADATPPYLSTDVYPVRPIGSLSAAGSLVTYYDEATALLTCHLLARMPTTSGGSATGGGSSLPVTSDRTGDLMQSYAWPTGVIVAPTDAELMTTRYGALLIRLRQTRAAWAAPVAV